MQTFVTTESAPASSLVSRIEPIVDEIRERAPEIEDCRQVPSDIIERLVAAGLMRAMVPAERGGAEEDFRDWVQSVRLISRADMATGWVCGLLSCHAHTTTFFDRQVQDEVWITGPDTLIGTSGAPVGRSRRTDGGVYLSGSFPFSSGCDHVAWVIVGFIVPEGDTREAGPYYALVPRADFGIEDDWFTSGLRGTGSKSVVLEEAFVPEYRWYGPGLELPSVSPGIYENPMFTSAYLTVYNAPFAAIMLGGAEGALEIATTSLARRKNMFTGSRAAQVPARQSKLGWAALELRGVAAVLERNWEDVAEHLRSGRVQTPEEIHWWRASDAHASKRARRAVDELIDDAGGSAQYATKSLQRFWRDIHTGCEHPWLDSLTATQIAGQMQLGEPLTPMLG